MDNVYVREDPVVAGVWSLQWILVHLVLHTYIHTNTHSLNIPGIQQHFHMGSFHNAFPYLRTADIMASADKAIWSLPGDEKTMIKSPGAQSHLCPVVLAAQEETLKTSRPEHLFAHYGWHSESGK